ncbi:MAG: hypothetical protein V4787_14690 [Pseudomonadota bacterium]
MHHLTALIKNDLHRHGHAPHERYTAMLDHAFDTAPPPFGAAWFGRAYFDLARDKEWFANSLVANSALEGYGATQIWKFSNRLGNDDYVAAVRQHALDESRHSTMFVSMLNLTFPGIAIDDQAAQRIAQQQPRLGPGRLPPDDRLPASERMGETETLNELVQVHITEIRALVLQYLLRSVIQVYAPGENQERIRMFTDSLIRDETAHIGYTASIFEAADPDHHDLLMHLFEDRVRDFNDLTMIEFEREQIAI